MKIQTTLGWQPAFPIEAGKSARATAPVTDDVTPAPARRAHRANRSVPAREAVVAQSDAVPGGIVGDLDVGSDSLIGARIAATRLLYGAEADCHEDEEMLEIANAIHQSAQERPDDAAAVAASQTLLVEEAARWAERNGGEGLDHGSEFVLRSYLAAWTLAGHPPSPPAFKTRHELAAEDIETRGIEPEVKLGTELGKILVRETMSKEEHIAAHADSPEITARYYDQFAAYIEQDLDRLSAAKAFSIEHAAGIAPLASAQPAQQVWSVTLHDKIKHDLLKHDAGEPLAHGFLVLAKSGEYGFVGADGAFKMLRRPANADGGDWPWTSGTLQAAFGVGTSLAVDPQQCFVLKDEVAAESINTLIVRQTRQAIVKEIERWKAEHYAPSGTEAFLRAVIPFYETVHNLTHDRGYTLKPGDVAWDLFNLGLTLASIVPSLGVLKAAGSGVRAARAVHGANAASRAFAGLRAAVSSLRTGSFLRVAGRQLTDFVVPVFSVKDLAASAASGAKHLARETIRTLAQGMNRAAAHASDGSTLLDRIFSCLSRTHHLPDTPATARRIVETRANSPIPARVYRGHSVRDVADPLGTPWGRVDAAARDDYLAACIRHSARTGGSRGEVLSLTTDKSVAARFARERENAKVFAIDTTAEPENFRTIESIIVQDGPRLVEEGKITAATLSAAIRQSLDQGESELFYMLGSIPDTLIKTDPARVARAVWG